MPTPVTAPALSLLALLPFPTASTVPTVARLGSDVVTDAVAIVVLIVVVDPVFVVIVVAVLVGLGWGNPESTACVLLGWKLPSLESSDEIEISSDGWESGDTSCGAHVDVLPSPSSCEAVVAVAGHPSTCKHIDVNCSAFLLTF
jgi:hypothetical protein